MNLFQSVGLKNYSFVPTEVRLISEGQFSTEMNEI